MTIEITAQEAEKAYHVFMELLKKKLDPIVHYRISLILDAIKPFAKSYMTIYSALLKDLGERCPEDKLPPGINKGPVYIVNDENYPEFEKKLSPVAESICEVDTELLKFESFANAQLTGQDIMAIHKFLSVE